MKVEDGVVGSGVEDVVRDGGLVVEAAAALVRGAGAAMVLLKACCLPAIGWRWQVL